MEIVEKNKVTIYRYAGQYGASYSVGLSKKTQDGKTEYGFMPVRFKKDVTLENKTQIYIRSAWISFNKKDDKCYPYIFINEFTTLDQAIEPSKETLENKKGQQEIYLTDDDLPF